MPSPLRRFSSFLFDSPYLLLSLVSLFWAGNVVLGRFIAGHIPPITLSWIRWMGAFLVFAGFGWPYLRRDRQVVWANFGILTLLTLTGITAYNTIAYYGLQYTQAINALLIASTGPLLVAGATFAIYREKPTFRQGIGVFASLAGVIVVIARGNLGVLQNLQVNAGDIWFFSAQIVYAVYTALLRKRPPIHPFSFALVTIGWGTIMLTPALFVEFISGRTAVWDAASFATLIYIVLFPSLIAFIFYNRGVELIGPNRAAPFYHLIPLFGSILAIVFLGERLQIYHGAGYALILAGVAIATTSTRSRAVKISTASPAALAVAPPPARAHRGALRRRPQSRR